MLFSCLNGVWNSAWADKQECVCGVGGLGFTWCCLLQVLQSRNFPHSVTNVLQHLGWFFQDVITLCGVHFMQVELSKCEVWSRFSCGQPEQDEQPSPLSNSPLGGLGCPGVPSFEAAWKDHWLQPPESAGWEYPCSQAGRVSWGVLSSQGWPPSAQGAAEQQWQSNMVFHYSSGKIPPWEQKSKDR